MDMDAAMEEEFTGSSNDHMMIVKGRRTKRPRQTSPLRAVVTVVEDIKLITSNSSSDDGGGDDHGERGDSISSEISTTTEEDEDMANCLILLAQSGSSPRQVEQQQKEVKMERISSRRFTEMATTTGKAGIYVYECKTCNRTFPSFQALGGHRASHKKPKHMVEEKKVSTILDEGQILATTITPAVDDHHDEEHHEEGQTTRHLDPVPVSIHLANKASSQKRAIESLKNLSSMNKAKIHECSICGSEFSSGQALGGHMRRHRNIPTGNKGLTMNNIDTSTIESSSSHDGERPRNILQLDLNLPAPEDDQPHDSKFQFSANQHLFSSPALVDCHY